MKQEELAETGEINKENMNHKLSKTLMLLKSMGQGNSKNKELRVFEFTSYFL